MRILVQKYGGTSVKGLERMRTVLGRVQKAQAEGYKVVVALSAMSGITNKLLAKARDFSCDPDPAELDVLVTTGEQASVALFSMLAKDAGLKARSLLGFQIPIRTDSRFTQARIQDIDAAAIKTMFNDYDVLVVAGFQGVDCNGRLTTLGRGGSDTTGVALAAALGADLCEIYTDVNGVYTTDPNLCSTARKMERISYDEMLELSSQGAKVLQIRSVEFAKKYNVPVRVRCTFTDDPGTLVTQEDTEMEDVLVSGIAYDKDQCRITVRNVLDRPGMAASLFAPIAEAGITVDMGLLRVFLATMIVVLHTAPEYVQGFPFPLIFVLSGFYMGLVLTEKYTGPGRFRLFFTNRLLRLMPPYWIFLSFSLIVAVFYLTVMGSSLMLGPWITSWPHLSLSAIVTLITANITIYGQDLLFFCYLNPATNALTFAADALHQTTPAWFFLLIPQAWFMPTFCQYLSVASRPDSLPRDAVCAHAATILADTNLWLELTSAASSSASRRAGTNSGT